jgi:hypothetical protein
MASANKRTPAKKRSRRRGKESPSSYLQRLKKAPAGGPLSKVRDKLFQQPAREAQGEEKRWLLWGGLFFTFAFVLLATTEESLTTAISRAFVYGSSVALATWLGDNIGDRLGLRGRLKLWSSFVLVVLTVAAVQAFFGGPSLFSDWRWWKNGEKPAAEQREEVGGGGISLLSPTEQIEYTGLFLEALDGLSEEERQKLRALQKQDSTLLSPDEQEEYRRLWAEGVHHLSENKQKRLGELSKRTGR